MTASSEFFAPLVQRLRVRELLAASSEGEKEIIERERTFLASLVPVYEPVERLALYAGPGREFEENEACRCGNSV